MKQSGGATMPELPEVEVLRRDLDKEIVGKKIKSVEVTGNRSIRRHRNKKEFIGLLEGRKIVSVQRRGKYLVLRLDDPEALVVHLGMSGQLLRAKTAREKPPKHTHVVITFTQGGMVRFVDPRTFGEMFVTKYDDIDNEVDELAHLGIDPLETAMSWDLFGRMLAERKTKLKPLLMDQKFIAGIGNVYSDEILFQAGLKWDRMSDSLSQQEVRRLYRAISETLQDAVKFRGSSLADEQYVDLFGKPGEYQQYHQVYDREGEACQRCRRPIHRARYSNRSTFYCEACQV
jgi:formamidopyrimidine-DNA glycosylase